MLIIVQSEMVSKLHSLHFIRQSTQLLAGRAPLNKYLHSDRFQGPQNATAQKLIIAKCIHKQQCTHTRNVVFNLV